MSTDRTGALQLKRLREMEMSVGLLPEMSDIDYFDDAQMVAGGWPDGEFAKAFRTLEPSFCQS